MYLEGSLAGISVAKVYFFWQYLLLLHTFEFFESSATSILSAEVHQTRHHNILNTAKRCLFRIHLDNSIIVDNFFVKTLILVYVPRSSVHSELNVQYKYRIFKNVHARRGTFAYWMEYLCATFLSPRGATDPLVATNQASITFALYTVIFISILSYFEIICCLASFL